MQGSGAAVMPPGERRRLADPSSGGEGGPNFALLVRGVSHRFGNVAALDNVSLAVRRGEFAVLLGLNGAGKSTLFSLVSRLYDNVSGDIRILGYDVRREPSAALSHLGVVFQSRSVDLDLTLRQNLLYHAALHGLPRSEALRRADKALETVGLLGRAREKVRTLSGGQARRVEIARALLHRPACLILDEPTVGLDTGSRDSVLGIVRSLVAKERIGVLWATHLIDEVAPTDHIIVLHQGRILFTGSVPALLAATGQQSVREAFSSMTRVAGERDGAP